MSINEQENDQAQPMPWYADPRVKAICSIVGVGVSLSALLLATVFWVLSVLQTNSEDIPRAGSGSEVANEQMVPAPAQESDPLVHADGSEVVIDQQELGYTVENVAPADLSNVDSNEEPTDTGTSAIAENLDVTLSSATDFSQIIQGRTISLPTSIDARHPVYIVAENVSLSPSAILRGPKIWIFADEISGGSLDVSGSDGTNNVRDGSDAGSIYVLARRVINVDITAVGGNGIPGGQGASGYNGRDGSCAGFGGWRPAQRGGNGAPGEAGGKGGDGGGVRVVFGVSYQPRNVNRSGGIGSGGGPGGRPGVGGDGCVGLGGAQVSASSGSPGPTGMSGRDGIVGSLAVEEKPKLVADILNWMRDRTLSVEALHYLRKAEHDNTTP